MPEWLASFLKSALPSLAVGVFTALISVKLALRRFHAERWWERKADAYHTPRSCEIAVVHDDVSEFQCLVTFSHFKGYDAHRQKTLWSQPGYQVRRTIQPRDALAFPKEQVQIVNLKHRLGSIAG